MHRGLAIAFTFVALVSRAQAHDPLEVTSTQEIPQPVWNADGLPDLSLPVQSEWEDSCETTIRVVDAESKSPVGCVLRAYDRDGRRIALDGLMSRATALTPRDVGEIAYRYFDSWSLLPGERVVSLPRTGVWLETFRGPNSTLARRYVDLAGLEEAAIELEVAPLVSHGSNRWYSGNCHLHLQRMTLTEAERYACETSAGDGYDLVFFSYLERKEADRNYISNTFTPTDLTRFSERSGVLFGYGEEYRHNFSGNSEGYGHVMFLDLAKLILPASLGFAITQSSNDDSPLRSGIAEAKDRGATVLWCHGTRGFEDIPNWIAGLIDVQMIFDQGSLGTYEDALYRYLNVGLRAPLATGTDWFFRDMAMAYVEFEPPLTTERWLAALRDGKSFITNGPVLELAVNDRGLGGVVALKAGESTTVRARAIGRANFGALELVRNGEVISTSNARPTPLGYEAELQVVRTEDSSCWYAVRATPFDGSYDSPGNQPTAFNEYGKPIFAHSSAVYVEVEGKPVFVVRAAESLAEEVVLNRAAIAEKGDFTSDQEANRVLALYDTVIATLRQRIAERGAE